MNKPNISYIYIMVMAQGSPYNTNILDAWCECCGGMLGILHQLF